MKHLKQFVILLFSAVLLTACSAEYSESTCENLAQKIKDNTELTQDDYAAMIEQYDAIGNKILDKVSSKSDIYGILELMEDPEIVKLGDYADTFEYCLENADLSDENEAKFTKITEALEKRKNEIKAKQSEDGGFGLDSDDSTDDDSVEYDSIVDDETTIL